MVQSLKFGAIGIMSLIAFNDDMPYDQFLREQLAGDELSEVTPRSIIATGYYRLGLWDDEPADRELAFYDGIDDYITITSQVMLGLTINCARCHDHKARSCQCSRLLFHGCILPECQALWSSGS